MKSADKPKAIPKKIRAAIEALVSGQARTVTAAAEIAGLSREHLSRRLGEPRIAEHLRTKTMRNLSISAARAGHVKTELLDCDNAMVRDRASSFILGIAGIMPTADPLPPNAPQSAPGVVINIISPDNSVPSKVIAPPQQMIDVTPKREGEPVSHKIGV